MNKRVYKLLMVFSMNLLLVACSSAPHGSKQTQGMHQYKVKMQPLHKSLHFTGTLQPLHESTLASPMDAVVSSMSFHYGQVVKKDDVILTLDSNELQKQFNDTFTEYLKAKDSYTVAQAKFSGTQELWHSGLLAKNNYLSEKSSLATVRMSLMQSTRKLTEMLEKIGEEQTRDVSELTLSDFAKVKHILAAQHNLIQIKAPRDGVLLYPPKSGEDKNARITVGSAVKSGQVLALIGDLSGVSIEIEIPEIDVSQVHPGLKAHVRGVAFGKHPLTGEVVVVNAQASSSNNGLPFFTAVVEVHDLTAEQQRWIKVGMSATIEIDLEEGKQLIIPIAAVKRENGQIQVQVQRQDGSVQPRIIATGAALADQVVVESGLQEGDVIIYE
ncbi:MAG: hypothetical protein BGO90_10615 [Legionella sp. 40-6]|nr:efflux RND transporter periplasmic adaptor subunit [Legionella sp.]OJY39422.1 MAG: hypothetical protein BGO90_10615 [Legionella sp. 40-6]